MTADTLFAPLPTTQPAAPTVATTAAPRLDLYAHIHKAVRSCMLDTLLRCGRLDVQDAGEMQATLGQLDTLLALCTSHLQHENDFVHPAIEARQHGGARRIAGEHVEHLHHIAALRAEADRLRQAGPGEAPALALRLYRQLALFVGDNLLHMDWEETAHNTALWAAYTDAELAALHGRLLASQTPAEMALVLRWMVPALTPDERAGLLQDIRFEMPPEAFVHLVGTLRPHLNDTAWGKLAPAIGLAQQPGLVHFA